MSIDRSAADQTSPTRQLLLVDPDATERARLRAALIAAGYVVDDTDRAEAAAPLAEQRAPDLAVIALAGSGTAAIDLIRSLKQRLGPAVHIVSTLPSPVDEPQRAAAFSAGTDDLVIAPAALTDLIDRLAAATRHQRAFVEVRVAKQVADRRMAYGAEASAMLAHDLNNGLAVALLNLQLLRDTLTLDVDDRDALDTTVRSLRRMSSLVVNFVDVARFEDAEVSPAFTSTPMLPRLQAVVDINAPAIPAGVTVSVECEPALTGHFDTALIERVLHNLLGNAARYCRAGGTISVAARPWQRTGVEISVTNAGPQLPESIRPHLFERYVRGSGAKRGMGLYFCRLVADSHGGTVHHEATEIGPRFVLRLPGPAGDLR